MKFLAIFVVLCAGVSYPAYEFYKNHKAEQARQILIAKKKAEKKIRDQEAIANLQASHIEDFKADLKAAAKDYKDYTKILVELVRPQNFISEQYAKENYTLFTQDIEPTVRMKADRLLNVFPHYRKKLESLISDDTTPIKQKFLSEWREMHDVQLARSVEIMTLDDRLLDAYADLITFYYTYSRRYHVDLDAEEFVFKSEKDEEKQKVLLKVIADLRREKLTLR